MRARVVVVVGACGGVGASTLAALLALRAVRAGTSPVLVDLAATGGGVDVLLGTEDLPGVRWPDLAHVRGALAGADLDGALPTWRGVDVLGGDRRGGAPPRAAVEALWPALEERYGVVVVDAPAAALADDAVGGVLATRPHLLLVTGQDVRGVAAGLTAAAGLEAGGAPGAQLVLRRRRSPRVAPLEAAQVLDAPLLGLLPGDRRVAAAVDRGFGPWVPGRSALARSVERVARGCGITGPVRGARGRGRRA
ncbi:pilus assembly protein FlpE [Actinotalea sp. JY-7876]|uniref:pilus assembly protein FlpE n=2 Tax=unclassified Actinotalea TaxID=2638618 RepID=UPI0015F70CFC|nr:pilus assembly protein FlpE [Actinotalea sp. JY-7876]